MSTNESAQLTESARARCYVAIPLGFSEAGHHYYQHVYLPALARVVDPVDPWSLPTDAVQADPARDRALAIGRSNAAAIRECTLLAAILDGQEVDAGTAAEVGYGAALGLTCFGLRSDLRQSGEDGAIVNLQLETFILDSGGVIVATLAELVSALGQLAG